MSEEFRFDPVDLLRFTPVALRQATRKGYLNELKKGNEMERKYFVLCGNLLYSFTKEADPSTLCGIIFLESSVSKIVTSLGNLALSVATVGGKTVQLTAANQSELVEWMEAIENSKFIAVSRKLEDTESRVLQLHHQVEQGEIVSQEYEKSLMDMKEQLRSLTERNKEMEQTIESLKAEAREVNSQLKHSEKERLMLLKSRGITPKELPLWALSEQQRGGVQEPPESIRIWTGTWNLSSCEPFAGMEKQRAQRLLQPFVPPGYDLYVLGVQECVSDSVFDCLNGLLEAEGCRRLRLDNFHPAGVAVDVGSPSVAAATTGEGLAAPFPSCTGMGSTGPAVVPGDLSKVVGRGDGSLISMKYTGIAVYAHVDILADVRLLSVTNLPLSSSNSRGGVAVALSVMGRTVAFVCCQLDLKSDDARREQYQSLLTGLGSQLAEAGYHLNEQFHHVIWCGDFSYTLVDTSGNRMPPDSVVKMLQDGRLFRTLFETHDQLNQERKDKAVFFGYREAAPFPNFYPTYKRLENRNPVDYTHPAWVTNTYRIAKKASFFKGGATREYTPAFSDRILYHSMVDLAEDLVPECLPVEMNVYKISSGSGSESPSSCGSGSTRSSGGGGRRKSSNASDHAVGGQQQVVSIVGAGPPIPRTLAVVIDNYRSVNDGEGLNVSDHAPVFGTFVLRLRHNFEKILSDSAGQATGSIRTVLSALSQSAEEQLGSRSLESPSKKDRPNHDPDQDQAEGLVTPPRHRTSRHGNAGGASGLGTAERGKKRSGLSSALSAAGKEGEGAGAVAGSPGPALPLKVPKYSLLPPGIYRVRISGLKLMWGMNEENPASASLLFPAPYEAAAGERFADFKSDTELAVARAGGEDGFSLACLSSSLAGGGDPAGLSTPSRGRPLSAQMLARSAPSPKAAASPLAARAGAETDSQQKYELWERTRLSRTGTSLSISAGAYYRNNSRYSGTEKSAAMVASGSSKNGGGRAVESTTGPAKTLAPLVLTWRGAEPLDKLHMSIRVCMPAFSFNGGSTPGRGGSGGGGGEGAAGCDDTLTGHCAVGLEQLCKVAMVSSGGVSGCVTVTRLLVTHGRPMYNIDPKTLQREMVTLCCTLELLPNTEADC